MIRTWRAVSAVGVLTASLTTAFGQATIQPTSASPGGGSGSAVGASRDGRLVTGSFYQSADPPVLRGYRWISDFADPFGPETFENIVTVGISGSGRAILFEGWLLGWTAHQKQIVREGEGFTTLPSPPNLDEWHVTALSLDGNTAAGYGIDEDEGIPAPNRSFRWTQTTGMQPLNPLPGGSNCRVHALNADGAFAVGLCDVGASRYAVRWDATGTPTALPLLAAHQNMAGEAHDISDDGSVVVGRVGDAGSTRPYKWTFNQDGSITAQDLGNSTNSYATRVSGDGRVVTGIATISFGNTYPFICREGQPFRALRDDLTARGLALGFWTLNAVTDLGYDASFFVGNGRLSNVDHGFIIRLGPPCGTSDFNADRDSGTDQDIEAFFACLAGNCCNTCLYNGADFNGDGDAGTDADIESFFRVLGGGNC